MWDDDFGWGGWLAMTIGMAGVWVLIGVLIVALLRSDRQWRRDVGDSREILEHRLARGEIDIEDYRRRLEAIDQIERGAPSSSKERLSDVEEDRS